MVAYEGAIHNILFSLGIKHAVAAATGNPADKVTKLLSTGKPTVYIVHFHQEKLIFIIDTEFFVLS